MIDDKIITTTCYICFDYQKESGGWVLNGIWHTSNYVHTNPNNRLENL